MGVLKCTQVCSGVLCMEGKLSFLSGAKGHIP